MNKIFNGKIKTWVLCLEPSENNKRFTDIKYWGSKGFCGNWIDELSQATHYATFNAAKSKLTLVKNICNERSDWYGVLPEDKIFIGEIDDEVQIKEI